ncbi:MAG TPA: oligosaccharide flippase family protein [Chloroflexota bacterium]|nr:oligosaccharide flippase family protein [Chloroflexota bacterium]
MTADPDLAGLPPPQPAARAVLTTAATSGFLAVLALATGVLAARLLGPAGRGHLAAAQAVGTLLGTIGGLSLAEAIIFFVGRRIRPPMVILRTATLVATASTVVLITAAFFSMPLLLAGQPGAIDAARVYALIGVPLVLLGFPTTLMRALQRYDLWNLLRLIGPVCWLLVLLAFTLAAAKEVALIIASFILLQVLLSPLVWFLIPRSGRSDRGVDLALIKPMLRYGTPLFLATLPQALNLRLDQLLIANVETADQLGLYAVSVSWAGIGLPLLVAIGAVLFPKLAAMQPGSARTALAESSRAGAAIALVIGVISAVSAPIMVPLLFGDSFSVPFILHVLLAAATSVLGLNVIIEEGLRGLGSPRSVLLAESTGLAVTVLLLVLLVPRLGIIGAALASLVAYAMVNAILVWTLKRRVGVGASELLVPRLADLHNVQRRLRAVVPRRGRKG